MKLFSLPDQCCVQLSSAVFSIAFPKSESSKLNSMTEFNLCAKILNSMPISFIFVCYHYELLGFVWVV